MVAARQLASRSRGAERQLVSRQVSRMRRIARTRLPPGGPTLYQRREKPPLDAGSFSVNSRAHMKENVSREAIVVVIDDDASVRAALKELFDSVGLEVRLYASAGAFLQAPIPDTTSCLVLDVGLPGMSGIKVQEELSRAGVYVPIVFVTGHGDVAMAVRAMKAGAIDFLIKPFRGQDLLDAVFVALERDSARRKMQQLHSAILKYHRSLSRREREVIRRVAAGKLNKQIAAELGLSEVTVKVHRASAMRKMHATTLPHLIKMLEHVEQCDMTSRSPNLLTA